MILMKTKSLAKSPLGKSYPLLKVPAQFERRAEEILFKTIINCVAH